MAVTFLDGVDWENTSGILPTVRYPTTTGTVTIDSGTGKFSGNCLKIGSSSTASLAQAATGIGAGAALRLRAYVKLTVGAGAPGEGDVFSLRTSGGTDQGFLRFRPSDNRLSWFAGSTLASSTSYDVDDGSWHHIELHVTVDNSAGAVYCWVDGALAFSATSLDTQLATWTAHNFRMIANRVNASNYWINYFDDVVWDDGTVGTQQGEHRIYSLAPNSDSAVQFTPSTGATNYGVVDEQPADSTDYNNTTTVNNQDLFGHAAIGVTPSAIYAVAAQCVAIRTAGTSGTIAAVVKSGSTTDVGTGVSQGGSQTWVENIRSTDPNTSAAWLVADVDSATWGYKATALAGGGANARVYASWLAVLVSTAEVVTDFTVTQAAPTLTGKSTDVALGPSVIKKGGGLNIILRGESNEDAIGSSDEGAEHLAPHWRQRTSRQAGSGVSRPRRIRAARHWILRERHAHRRHVSPAGERRRGGRSHRRRHCPLHRRQSRRRHLHARAAATAARGG